MPGAKRGCAIHSFISSTTFCFNSELNHFSEIEWIDRCHFVFDVGLSSLRKMFREDILFLFNAIDTRPE